MRIRGESFWRVQRRTLGGLKYFVLGLSFLSLLGATATHAEGPTRFRSVSSAPRATRRHPEFSVPARMQPRVRFWIDIFAKYGQHDVVFHHRMHPHVIFDVLSLGGRAQVLSDKQLERERKSLSDSRERMIRTAIQNLSSGRSPESTLERHIAKQMAFLGAGTKKYREVLDNGWIRSQRGIKERYREALERSGRYMHILEHIFVTEFGLPVELTRLPFVESSFDYKAYSSVGAAGIWQFMPGTGKLFKLQVSRLVDERRDVTAATKAAAKYLLEAYGKLNAWPLALTSYNHGVYGVMKKVKQFGTRDIAALVERVHDQPFGFASQNFYPEFLAALEIYEHPTR
ncbi:MAG: lytic transglycosylase domain-containing protein, partial [Bdellovibrionales bacterium]|nr:lytic transglycosylase domain-containing protein [Bdellovibrionales bacterium]